ncbi:hypothetical protein [Paenibacillus ginsengihumi]|jgi:hypothetical protein|uniref:hypothetical protein n=1 Tax=Paenibacillus ginsengihumi TaxID=431596 RepID=UPI000366AF29|nr:hypothetical protein [Paenibacillus ginsengihumi]
MKYTFTRLLTLIGIALCAVHWFGHEYDPIYLLFYALSVPAWFWPIFEYTNVNFVLLYLTTILSWALIGYVIDRFAAVRGSRRKGYR